MGTPSISPHGGRSGREQWLVSGLHSGWLKVSGTNEMGKPNGEPKFLMILTLARLRPATVIAGRRHAGPCPATSSDRNNSSYKRGAAGSNPAAPTVLAGQTHAVINEMIVREPKLMVILHAQAM
jgi:hypothetical protein